MLIYFECGEHGDVTLDSTARNFRTVGSFDAETFFEESKAINGPFKVSTPSGPPPSPVPTPPNPPPGSYDPLGYARPWPVPHPRRPRLKFHPLLRRRVWQPRLRLRP
jgi:hypothetical protein